MNIFLTLDYELFMGVNSGTVQNCLITPALKYIEILKKYDIKSTVFVDAAYLYKLHSLKEMYPKLDKDYSMIANNIRFLKDNGHDIEFHFHPQWIYSTFDNTKWHIDVEHYKLSDFDDTRHLRRIFSESKKILESIIGYECVAFRAGGYCIQTYHNIVELFQENGILIDSSVLRYAREDSQFQQYDYTVIPKKQIYKFSESVTEENQKGEFIEMSISSNKYIGIQYALLRMFYKYKHRNALIYGDGIGIESSMNKKSRLKQKIRKLLSYNTIPMIMDIWMAYFALPKTVGKEASKDIVILGHPKNFTSESLYCLEKFIIKAVEKQCLFKTARNLI